MTFQFKHLQHTQHQFNLTVQYNFDIQVSFMEWCVQAPQYFNFAVGSQILTDKESFLHKP